MLRSIYIRLLRLHPAAFRQRFGDGMLEIFDTATGLAATLLLTADGLISLIRQWAFRAEYRRPLLAVAASGGSSEVPLFRTMEPYKPRPAALFHGGLLTVLILCGLVGLLGKGATARAFLMGVRHPSPHLLPVDRASVAESDLNSIVRFGPEPEDPWRPIASIYFQAIRVLSVLDADRVLTISQWEMITGPAALRRLDVDHDGKLSAEECGFSLGAGSEIPLDFEARARLEFMRANPVLAALDADRDGAISASEIAKSSSALRKLDGNGDGHLSADELIPDQTVTQAAVIMVRLDADGDGTVSRTEWESEDAQPLREILQSADRNHDGLMTREELRIELGLRGEKKRELDNARRAAGLR
jgi:Ca2+-binding EF-hand superfamily protein